jgi:hypothetical protein
MEKTKKLLALEKKLKIHSIIVKIDGLFTEREILLKKYNTTELKKYNTTELKENEEICKKIKEIKEETIHISELDDSFFDKIQTFKTSKDSSSEPLELIKKTITIKILKEEILKRTERIIRDKRI